MEREQEFAFNGSIPLSGMKIERAFGLYAPMRPEEGVPYFPFYLSIDDRPIVTVHEDGTPEFGPGITAENVWQEIAKRLPVERK